MDSEPPKETPTVMDWKTSKGEGYEEMPDVHSGIKGNKKPEKKAESQKHSLDRRRVLQPDIVTPAGIRQVFPVHSKPHRYLEWDTQVLKSLTYLLTDRGTQRAWLWEIRTSKDPFAGGTPRVQASRRRQGQGVRVPGDPDWAGRYGLRPGGRARK